MRFFVGTSGYSYKEWKGIFYPEKMSPKKMLGYYAERFSTVEINNTFKRFPTESSLDAWAQQVPEKFRFVLKAPELITHRKRLKDVTDQMADLQRAARSLDGRLGPLLFQLPPNFKKDLPRFEEFLALVERGMRVAFEFRHESWLDEEIYDRLRQKSCALCVADAEELPSPPLVNTASWGYVRLRREDYTDAQLRDWLKRLKGTGWDEAYVFFKHEDSATGPRFAARFLELAD